VRGKKGERKPAFRPRFSFPTQYIYKKKEGGGKRKIEMSCFLSYYLTIAGHLGREKGEK